MADKIKPQISTGDPHTVLTTKEVGETISRLAVRVSPEAEKHMRNFIETSSRLVRHMNLQFWFEMLERARAASQVASNSLQRTNHALEAAQRDLSQTEPTHTLRLLVWFLCWLTCAAGEYVITWSTLPFVLNVPEDTLLAFAISAVPVAALTVLEWVIARALEEPYQHAIESLATLSKLRHRMVQGTMTLFLLLLLAGNLATIRLLAHAREESVKLRQVLTQDVSGTGEVSVDYAVINSAVMAVSMAVVVDGALLFLLAMNDLKKLNQRMSAQVRALIYRRKLSRSEHASHFAEAEKKKWENRWNDRVAFADWIAEDFRNKHLLDLQQVLDRKFPQPASPSLEEIVNMALSAPANSAKRAVEAS